MKKLYALLVVVLIGFVGKAQIVNIPDANLKSALLLANTSNQIAFNAANNPIKIDVNNDGQIQLSETVPVYRLYLYNLNISSLSGIESFSSLNNIYCAYNNISSVNLSGMPNLQILGISSNPITTLNLSLTNLTELNCNSSSITNLDVSNLTSLVKLYCNESTAAAVGLSSLNISGLINLQELYCQYNEFTNLDLSTNVNLKTLDCSYSPITSLNLLNQHSLESLNANSCALNNLQLFQPNNALTTISIISNQITNFNFNVFPSLTYLDCSYNPLVSLAANNLINLTYFRAESLSSAAGPSLATILSDSSNYPVLQSVFFDTNSIGTITINQSHFPALQDLYARSCNLTQLTLNTPSIKTLAIRLNQITDLNLSNLSNLEVVECWGNPFSSLNLNNSAPLNTFYYGSSPPSTITSLDFSSFPLLTNLGITASPALTSLNVKNGASASNFSFSSCPNLQYICASENQLAAIQTKITNYGYTNCHVNSYCSFTPGGTFYNIQGNNRYDSNNNGCDVNDINYPNLKLTFSNGTSSAILLPDTTGAYSYYVQASTQTFSPVFENPTYFTASPATATATFPPATSPFTQDFCVTANGVHNDLEVALLPIVAARPGSDAKYKIIYKNKGTGPQSGVVNLAFDDSRLDYVSAVPNLTTQVTNSLSWSFSNLLPFETREILVTLNVNSPTETPSVNSGDVLTYTAKVTGATDETPNDNLSTLNQTVVNALDPNDKTCIEGTTITPSMVGQYVHYVVRFENDGTANAQNIVVKDMIDTTKFDISSLIPLSGSAAYTTRITNTNQVEFIFQNINLPFAAGTNTGYVAFKIKTKPTLVVGNTFSNSANIYFDYNAPIVTNTATTTIATLGTQDFDFGSVFTLSPVPAKNSLTISTKQEVMISSLSIYNTLGQLVQVITNPTETIDVSGLQSGSYFVRITSDKGSATGKFIKE